MSARRTTGRRPWVMASITWLYIVWSLVPVVIAVLYSFNDSRSRGVWAGFTTDWYCCTASDSVAEAASITEDPQLLEALQTSLVLALLTALVAVPIGTALALGTTRWRSRPANVVHGASLVPLVTPELVLGSALYVVIVTLYPAIGLGMTALVLGHSTLTIAYVTLIVRARLVSLGAELEWAAQDLGATPLQAIRTVLLPLMVPAVIASTMITIAVSLDDFIVTNFLFGDAENQTVPLILYSVTRQAPTPVLNALATVLLAGTLVLLTVTYLILKISRRGAKGSALDEVAQFG